MRQFIEVGWGDGDRQPHAIDWSDPLDQLIEAEELDDCATIDTRAIRGIPKDALIVLMRFLIPPPELRRGNSRRWRTAQLRVALLANMAGMEGVGEMTLTELGKELGCTRSLLSLYSTRMADSLDEHTTRHGRTRETRNNNRIAAIASHQARGHKVKAYKGTQDGELTVS